LNGLIQRWFGSKAAPPALAEAVAELDKLAARKPSLATGCQVLRQTLEALFADEVAEAPPSLDPASAHEKLAAGLTLLRGVPVALDGKSLRSRWLAVCQAVATQNGNAKAVADAYSSIEVEALLAEVLAGRPEAVHARADTMGLDAALTGTVFRLAVFPVLASIAAALESLRAGLVWEQGSCPTCGSWPLLAELRGLDQNRFLRCGLCASDWPFPRLRCPFCSTSDHQHLGYFQIEGEESRYRAATCDACHGYVKTAFTLEALSPPRLLVADLATLHLDLAAADRGFFVASL
jgi:FdhE protein